MLLTALDPGTSYIYTVSATNHAGSVESKEARFTTLQLGTLLKFSALITKMFMRPRSFALWLYRKRDSYGKAWDHGQNASLFGSQG